VIGGYRPLANSVDAILVGYYEGGDLRFAAKVRAGFIPHVRREVYAKLKPLATTRCPFADLPSEKSRWGGGVGAEQAPGRPQNRFCNPGHVKAGHNAEGAKRMRDLRDKRSKAKPRRHK
jgi:hypothetical protein